MCGLAGYVGLELSRESLRKMSAAIQHRGPDDEGDWIEPEVGFAFRRLSIIDLSILGHQPMLSTCGRYVLVFNGEIYNYIELRDELRAHGHVFRGKSDSEVLLAAYILWGRECVTRFNGMWSFAIWDRTQRTLFASRDRFGKKPFYYSLHGQGFIFGSEIKCILASGLVTPRPNPDVLGDFCADRVLDHTEATCFENIFQLPAACSLTWADGSIRISRYWDLITAAARRSGDFSAEHIKKRLTHAVSLRLRSDVPVGVLLSGGLDSSSVTSIAARLMTSDLHAFSTVDEEPSDEARGIALVSNSDSRLKLHTDSPTVRDFISDLDSCLHFQEEPFADGSMVAHFRLMRLARSEGVKVMLTGQGADEVFAGYPGYVSVYVAGLIRRGHFREASVFVAKLKSLHETVPFGATAAYSLPAWVRSTARRARAATSVAWLIPEFRHMSPVIRDGYRLGTDPLKEALADSIAMRTLPGFLHYEDRNGMAFGIESRLPFLDFELVEEIFSIPSEKMLCDGYTKVLLRTAMKGVLPEQIRVRPGKQGYPAPLGTWLLDAPAEVWAIWREIVTDCPVIQARIWTQYCDRLRAGGINYLAPVWRGLIVALWYRNFIAGRTL